MMRHKAGPSFRLKLMPEPKTCGFYSVFLLVFVFLFVLCLFLRVINQHDLEHELRTRSYQSFIPEWNWIKAEDKDMQNCNFENYVLGQRAKQDDPCLVSTFKKKMLVPPPPYQPPTQVEPSNTNDLPTNKEKFKFIEKLIIEKSEKKTGFFIECGANDGEFISPTISLERIYNWTGLLIEANPIPFQSLIQKKRNAWAVNAAACIKPYPEQITFYTNPRNTGLSGLNQRAEHGVSTNISVQCIPLYTMLKALEITTVDYLSLDVEGLELAILKTLPWDKISFKVMTIEHGLIPGGKNALTEFLTGKGYKFVKELNDALTLDILYVHQTLYEQASKIKI